MATATAEAPSRMFIAGEWTGAAGGGTIPVTNPADESTLATVAYGGRADADRAIEAAARRPSPPGRPSPPTTGPRSSRRPPT